MKKNAIANDIDKAVALLKAGGLVAFPTETVYGLGADARNPQAVAKIFTAKKRPRHHPLIVHLAAIEQLNNWVTAIPPAAHLLAEAFWPGPVTLILPKAPHVLAAVTGGQETVGVRIPNHPVALELLKAFGDGLVAPSANQFTHISPTHAQAVQEELGDAVDMILEGGDCAVGVESTIVDLSTTTIRLLRPGMLSQRDIEKVLQQKIIAGASDLTAPRVPGMHDLHYAPQTFTVKIPREANLQYELKKLQRSYPLLALITYRNLSSTQPDWRILQLANNPTNYAHDFYRRLRQLDHSGVDCIVIDDVPAAPEWDALRDRINKASRNV